MQPEQSSEGTTPEKLMAELQQFHGLDLPTQRQLVDVAEKAEALFHGGTASALKEALEALWARESPV